ncbi:hypothetical protein TPR58_14510 [Sphingomonas sp. HF-S3]|uniref:Uncharacterized protein n=1 Tax=Sphingomonas rustica TaxID=3103142 RepID=A0ABV0B9Y3_9SPHN
MTKMADHRDPKRPLLGNPVAVDHRSALWIMAISTLERPARLASGNRRSSLVPGGANLRSMPTMGMPIDCRLVEECPAMGSSHASSLPRPAPSRPSCAEAMV